MKTITITESHPFFKDFDKKVIKEKDTIDTSNRRLVEYVKEWYNLTNIVIDDLGTSAEITMTDPQYTLWLMMW